MLEEKKSEIAALFKEFNESYLSNQRGHNHANHYIEEKKNASGNLKQILSAEGQGEALTELVLTKLLPYAGLESNIKAGYWISIAPAFNGDVRKKYKKLFRDEDWPKIAKTLLNFIKRCYNNPDQLPIACNDFLSSPYSKGFQAGILSPILHALKPDDFILINNKSRTVINYFAETSYIQNLKDYPSLNSTARNLISEIQEEMHQDKIPDIRIDDLFDMFSHWLVAIKDYDFKRAHYWIFQANPKYYDIVGAASKLKEISWKINRYKEYVHVGDIVYIWEAGTDAGIVAIGKIESIQEGLSSLDGEGEFVNRVDGEVNDQSLFFGAIISIERSLVPRIGKKSLLSDPLLKYMQILRQSQGTNFKVTSDEAKALDNLMKKPPYAIEKIECASSNHTQVQWQLAKIGKKLGCNIWIAANDQNKEWQGERLGDLSLKEMPSLGMVNPKVQRIIGLIDVLWIRGVNQIAAAFEVEDTTAIFSGLLRMSDLVVLVPILNFPLYIVAPENRLEKVKRQLSRPTFQHLELHRRCGFFSGEELIKEAGSIMKWAKDTSSIDRLASKVEDVYDNSI